MLPREYVKDGKGNIIFVKSEDNINDKITRSVQTNLYKTYFQKFMLLFLVCRMSSNFYLYNCTIFFWRRFIQEALDFFDKDQTVSSNMMVFDFIHVLMILILNRLYLFFRIISLKPRRDFAQLWKGVVLFW